MDETTVVAEGSFVGKQHTTSGSYTIERPEGGEDLTLVLSEDFETAQGPDLHVVLSPLALEDVNSENVLDDGSEVIDDLESASGEQSYDLPSNLDLESYESVGIHCIQYKSLFGAAKLE